MLSAYSYFWKRAPFLKLLIPLAIGIVLQWYAQIPIKLSSCWLLANFIVLLSLFTLPILKKFQYRWLIGLVTINLLASMGAVLTWREDIRNHPGWFGHFISGADTLMAEVDEPLILKPKSYKAIARIVGVMSQGNWWATEGKMVIYFEKDSSLENLDYGNRIVFHSLAQPIRNSNNPGAFDYQRYSLFNKVTHQVYLRAHQFVVVDSTTKKGLYAILFNIRRIVLQIIKENIDGHTEAGLAEALLIGYKNDLDKSLVQSYSNTGVVHVIAISGLHIGLIYWLLIMIFQPLKKFRRIRWLAPITIIAGLWIFSLLAGAQPSVLRSAVMFTFIVVAAQVSRNSSIYNTLAASAFLLLCFNPFWLWDAGFQLSYSAVLSIVIFMKPVYQIIYVNNRILDWVWKLNAVTIAAQILTFPVIVYHFHQFPNYFIIANLVAVPLSSLILFTEIVLCAVSFIPVIAAQLGRMISWMIRLMNDFVVRVDQLPFATWDSLLINISQLVLLYTFIAGISGWLLEKLRQGVIVAMASAVAALLIRMKSFVDARDQQRLIVYNLPGHTAVEIFDGRNTSFFADSLVDKDFMLKNFHIKPARILYRAGLVNAMPATLPSPRYFQIAGKSILWISNSVKFNKVEIPDTVDLLLISKSPALFLADLAGTVYFKSVVADASVPFWKLKFWKRDCDSLKIPWHSIRENGAFVMKCN